MPLQRIGADECADRCRHHRAHQQERDRLQYEPGGAGADAHQRGTLADGVLVVAAFIIGFADADVIIERTYNSTQAQQCPTETHICFTRMDGDRLVIHASTQVPWHLRRQVARLVGMKQHKVHVIKERVGGGFGSKQDILLEEVCAWATCVTGRPVLFRYTREEEFIANTSRHVAKVTVKLGAKKDGRLTAVKMDFRANTGPYGNHSLTVPCNGPAVISVR